ncbi:twin-arginine translocase subunit TatC, partial [Mycobacterium ulcerans]
MFKQLFKNNEDKAEMSFFDHLEELRWHIIRSLFAILIGFVVIFVKIVWVYDRVIMGPAHPDFI